MDLSALLQFAIGLTVFAAALSVLRGVAHSLRESDEMHDLKVEVHRVHAGYQARLLGMGIESDVDIVGSIPLDASGKPPGKQRGG